MQAAPARNAAARCPRAAWLALAAFAVAVNAYAQSVIDEPPYAPDSGTLSVRCGALIDGISDAVRRDVIVHIERGRIASVEPAEADRGRGAGGPALDLGSYTCLPGLADMHTHIVEMSDTGDLSVYYTRTPADQVENGRRNAVATLRAGFTTVRDVGTYIAFSDKALRDEINEGKAIGPRMQVAGFYLTIPGGGGDLVIPGHAESEIPAHARFGLGRTPEEFARAAQRAIDGGADVIKVIASGAVLAYGGVPGAREMSEADVAAVVKVAHANGRKVAAHAHGADSIKDAIRAGADTIEHASLIDDEAIALAREHAVALSMDVYNGDYIDTVGRAEKWPEEFLRKNVETTEAQRQGFTKAYRAGVPIVYGTDAAVYPHGDNAKQFRIMVERGMAPMDAIRSATSVAAKYLGWSDRMGALTPGRYGDLIAVRGDPLEDITVLERVDVVIKGGLVFKLPAALELPQARPPGEITRSNMEYDDAAAHEQARAMGMALYYVYLLKKGPTWSPDSTPEIAALQEAHLANLQRLREEGKLVLNGPLLDSFQLSAEIRGIGVLKATSMEEARTWIGTDPMVKVGRLVFELHAWMVPEGILP